VLVGALAIAGPFFRVVFGVLEAFIGVAVLFSAVLAVSDPVAASGSAISTATGVAGDKSVAALVDTIDGSVWPWIALVCGVLMLVAGAVIIVASRRWPGSASRKYQTTRLEPAAGERTSVDDWDALSGGNDPTTND
jgi:ascorbate-specific PTS system EIIC-type component UlaA